MTNTPDGLRSTLVKWDEFWFLATSPFPLAMIRILIGVLACFQFLQYLVSGADWLGAQGFFDPETGLHFIGEGVEGTGSFYRWSFLYAQPWLASTLAAIGLIASLCLILGLGARIAPCIAWVSLCNFHHRAPLLVAPDDLLLSAALIYLIIDTGRLNWSVRPAIASGEPRVSANVVIRLFQCHFWIWIAFSLASMLSFPVWWNGQAAWILVQDRHGWLGLSNDWESTGLGLTHLVVALQGAILFCMLQPTCHWLGRWMLYAFLLLTLLLTGDWMYAASLLAYSLATWPISFRKTKGTS
jgi:hypothetical protein